MRIQRPATIREALEQLRNLPPESLSRLEPSTSSISVRPLPQGVPQGVSLAQVKPALLVAVREAFAAQKFPVFMFGPVGCGKTCAAACIYQSWRASETRPGTVRWRRCDTLLDEILKARFSDGVTVETPGGDLVKMTESGLFNMFGAADLAVLDDVGTSKVVDERYSALLRLLDSRVGKPTLITSNKNPQELQSVYDYRIISRMIAGTVIHVSGEDRRLLGSEVKSV